MNDNKQILTFNIFQKSENNNNFLKSIAYSVFTFTSSIFAYKEKKRKVTMQVWQRRKNPTHLTEKLIKRARKYSCPALCHMWACSGILAGDDKSPFTFSVSFQSVSRDRQAFLFLQGGVDQVSNSYPWQMLNLPTLAW